MSDFVHEERSVLQRSRKSALSVFESDLILRRVMA